MASKPDPIDVHVGSRVKLRRTLLGLSQDRLAESLGITFQQVQKYENGANRVGASRLFQIGRVMGVPVSFFFDGYQQDDKPSQKQVAESKKQLDDTVLAKKETLDLVRSYYGIEDPTVRKKIFDMIKSLGETDIKQ